MCKIVVACTLVSIFCFIVYANDIPDSDHSLLGAYEDVDQSELDCPEIQDAAKFATCEISARMKPPNGFNLVKVNSAKKQVVSGVNYNMIIVVIPNQGERESDTDSQVGKENAPCPPGPCNNALTCEVTVYAIPWLHEMKLNGYKCNPDQSTCL